ncbi:MAG: CCA tRNA nucleotidyltransferase [Thermoplasmata archaeon]
MDIEARVLKRILPSSEEQKKIDDAVGELFRSLKSMARKRELPFEPLLVGSIAKGTHLTHPDIDMFLRFPIDISVERMGKIDKEVGRELLDNPEERYAEHAYISGFWHGFRTDLVPCYDVPSGRGRISAVDRTPFHTEYVKKNLESSQRNDVRLLKQFLKGIGIYGAEARIQGFSGYLSEILVIRFGDFRSVVKAGSKWKLPVQLSLEEKPSREFDEQFIFVDPVDPNRNVASPVSAENVRLFIEACRSYLRSPKLAFFFPKKQEMLSDDRLRALLSKRKGTILVDLPHIDVVEDVLWPQLRKTGVSMFEILEREGFSPSKLTLDSDSKGNYIVISCDVEELPRTYIHFGPPVNSPEVDRFRAKWATRGVSPPVIKKGRWQVEVEREARTPSEVLLMNFPSVRLGKGFRKMKLPVVVSGDGLLSRKYRRTLTKHFDEKRPWER